MTSALPLDRSVPGRRSQRGLSGGALAALLVACVAVHELRYLVVFGGDAGRLIGHQGHPALAVITPMLALVLGGLLGHLAPRGRLTWPTLAVGLLAIYAIQAACEGVIAPGPLTGEGSVEGHSGWIALPLILAFSGLVTYLAGAMRARLNARVARAIRLGALRAAADDLSPLGPGRGVPIRRGFGRHLASRPPPVFVV